MNRIDQLKLTVLETLIKDNKKTFKLLYDISYSQLYGDENYENFIIENYDYLNKGEILIDGLSGNFKKRRFDETDDVITSDREIIAFYMSCLGLCKVIENGETID